MLCRWGVVACGILLLALASLVRSSAIPLAVLATLVIVRQWRVVAMAGVVTVVALLPWAIRNKIVLNHWIWTTTNGGHTAYDGFKPTADGGSDLSALRDWPALRAMGEVQRDRYLGDLARRAMLDDPARALRLAATKIARTWSPVPLSDSYGSGRNRLIGLAYALPLMLLTLIGLLRRGLPAPAKALCLLPAIYFTAVHAWSVGSLRYRVPAEPPMAIVAAVSLRQRQKSEGRRMNEDREGIVARH